MADKVVSVPEIGNIAFPDTMSDGDISTKIRQTLQQRKTQSVIDAAQAQQPQGTPLQRFGSSLYNSTIGAVPGILRTVGSVPLSVVPGETGRAAREQLYKSLVEPQLNQFHQAANPQLSTSERFGHALAGALPVAGPFAAGIGEQAGSGDFAGAAGSAAGGALMAKAPGAALDVLKSPIAAGAAEGAFRGAVEPGSGYLHRIGNVELPASAIGGLKGAIAGRYLGGPHGAVIGGLAGAALPVIRGAARGAREAAVEDAPPPQWSPSRSTLESAMQQVSGPPVYQAEWAEPSEVPRSEGIPPEVQNMPPRAAALPPPRAAGAEPPRTGGSIPMGPEVSAPQYPPGTAPEDMMTWPRGYSTRALPAGPPGQMYSMPPAGTYEAGQVSPPSGPSPAEVTGRASSPEGKPVSATPANVPPPASPDTVSSVQPLRSPAEQTGASIAAAALARVAKPAEPAIPPPVQQAPAQVPPVSPPAQQAPLVQTAAQGIPEVPKPDTGLQVRAADTNIPVNLSNSVLNWMKVRKNVTVPQMQTAFGISGDLARATVADFRKRGLITGETGRYNYNQLPGESLAKEPEPPAPPPEVTQKSPEPPAKVEESLTPHQQRVADLRAAVEQAVQDGDDALERTYRSGLADAEKNLALSKGTKPQQALLSKIDAASKRIDELEDSKDPDDQAELAGLYKQMDKLETSREDALKSDVEKYGPRVANMRSLHAERELNGLSVDELRQRAVTEFGTSMKPGEGLSKLTPAQLYQLEGNLRIERLEREAAQK